MANYTVINGTDSQLVDINAGGTDVDAHTAKDGVTLTNTEIGTLLGTAGVAIMKDLTGVADASQKKRIVATAALFAST